MASSSSSSGQQFHEVFISFFGKDTRNAFTSHLHAALERKKIATFVDDKIERGEEISDALSMAIEQSKISIIVLSENFAFSSWCLDEVSIILQCKKKGQRVVPIFYHVDPFIVRYQKGKFEEAFAKHQTRYRDTQLEIWRAALAEVAGMVGDHICVKKDRREADQVEDIAQDIWVKLGRKVAIDVENLVEGLVGMESSIEKLKELLGHTELERVRIIGIWGIPGVGKTKTVEVLYELIKEKFNASSFLADVTEKSKRQGLECVRNELISEILNMKVTIKTRSLKAAPEKVPLSRTKVLIVLDDVNKSQDVEYLIGGKSCFGQGSAIIITSRNMKVLEVATKNIYTVEKLTVDQAHELLTRYAVGGNSWLVKYAGRVNSWLVKYTDGIPLALKELVEFLSNEKEGTLDSALKRLEKCLKNEIYEVLVTSYVGLDEPEQRLFLDVACFFEGENQNHVTKILDGCGFCTDVGINILVSRSLVTILNNNLQMNNLIREMGREIVRKESQHPGERTRVWTYNDIDKILTTKKGTKTVEGIFLNMSEIEKPICINPEAFSTMCNLRLLKIYNPHSEERKKVHLTADGLAEIPTDLVYLLWHCCSLNPKNPDELHMHYSNVIQLWKGTQILQKLKWIDLSYSQLVTEMPNLSKAPNLVSLRLQNCTRIKYLPSSISMLELLEILDLSGCTGLESVPELPPNLQYLDAHNCTSLKANSSSFPIGHGWGQRFIFTNCIELDQNTMWSKTQKGIRQRATADVKLYHKDKKQDLRPRFSSICICFPGSEIPEWFHCQNPESSVTTRLFTDIHDLKLMGFTLCAVVAFEDYNKDLGFTIKCQCNIKTKGDDSHDRVSYLSVWDKLDSPRFIGSDHVFIGYDFNLCSDWYSEESKYNLKEAFFEFSACDSDSGNPLDSCRFKKCGVCLLYAQDNLSEIEIVGESEIKFYSESDAEECNPRMIKPSSPSNPHFLSDGITAKRPRDNYCHEEALPSGNFSCDEDEELCIKRLK